MRLENSPAPTVVQHTYGGNGQLSVPLGDLVVEVAKNAAMGVPVLRNRRLKRPRTSEPSSSRKEWLERYAFQAVRALLPVTGTLKDRRIVEFGPGDYLTSGFALLAAGARSYTALDRFPGDYAGDAAKEHYRSIQAAWPECFPDLAWPADLQATRFPEHYSDRVTIDAASIEQTAVSGIFDIVCSFQVGEHVSDIQAFARQSREMLAPDGVAVHRIDFGPHGNWGKHNNPLDFLRPSEVLWKVMGSNRGTPNRHRAHEFNAAFAAAGLEVREAERELFDYAPDPATRAQLARRFRTMPAESLQISAVTYACRLPAARKNESLDA